jgi:hypothetical protein
VCQPLERLLDPHEPFLTAGWEGSSVIAFARIPLQPTGVRMNYLFAFAVSLVILLVLDWCLGIVTGNRRDV